MALLHRLSDEITSGNLITRFNSADVHSDVFRYSDDSNEIRRIHNTATDVTYRHINAIAAVNVEMHAKVAEGNPNEGLTGEMVHNTSVPQRFLVEICVLVNKLMDGPYAILYTSMIQHSHSVSLSLGQVDPYTLVKSSSVTATSSNEICGWRRCHRFGTTIPCPSVAKSRNTAGRV
ncbi:conserved hypothetical protein [Trichinella spiralis]|uniref:hypothetical protein n=1 Tax=Trichinella spiralis TaxID=6334 RepID=UPI0001EFD3AA|nr:conserved hypothetical protein [Trichinella spiralis]